MAERCRFCVPPPTVSILCPSTGRVRTKVQGEEVRRDPSQPRLARTSDGPLPVSRRTPDHSLQGSCVVLLYVTARDLAIRQLRSPTLNHLGDWDLLCMLVDVRICNVSREGNSQDPPETPALEDIQLRLQGPGECPGFGAIQEDWKNVHLEQAELCVDTDTGLPDPAMEAAHAVSRDGNTPTYLRIPAPVRLHMGAKIARIADGRAPSGYLSPGHGRVSCPEHRLARSWFWSSG